MFLKMKNNFVFNIFAVLVMSEGNMACFQENLTYYHDTPVGSSFYKECYCDEPRYTVDDLHWMDINGETIQPQGPGIEANVYTERQGNALNLVIRNTSKTMSGIYKCITSISGTDYALAYDVTVYDKMEFVESPTSQHLIEGSNSLISCDTAPNSEVIFSWAKGDKENMLDLYSNKYRLTNNGLIVMNVTKDDADTYKCSAYPAKGVGGDRYIKVEVYTFPEITEMYAMPESVVGVGEKLTIKCKAEGSPTPKYFWTKTSNNDENITTPWVQMDNNITFESVGADDRGTYECSASNLVGTVKKEITIDVHVGPEIINFNNITVIENTEIIILCDATGNPPPNVSIVYMGKSKQTEQSASEYERFVPNSSIVKIDKSHEGLYVCNATNTVDYETEIIYLKVLHKPYFKEQRQLIWAWNGSAVNLSCAHESSPAAVVTWSFKKGNVEGEEARIISIGDIEKAFIIDENKNETENYGVYTCKVVNDYGEAEKTIELRKGYPPTLVQNATVIEVTATSAKFSIETPQDFIGPEVIGFTAEYDDIHYYDVTNIHQNRTWSMTRPFRLEKLKPNTTYFIRFAAINPAGTGIWSEMIDFDTLEKSAPEPPIWPEEPLQVISTNQLLRWKAPEDNGDPIDYYALRYCPIYGKLDEKLCKAVRIEPTTELELSNLEYNTSYYFELVAHNSEGLSAPANISITVPAAPLQDGSPFLSAGVLIGISLFVVIVSLLLLDLLLLFWRQQGIIAACCYKKNKKKTNDLKNSRDKKGLLKDNRETSADDASRRANNGHREFEYNKTTGIITGKHSSV